LRTDEGSTDVRRTYADVQRPLDAPAQPLTGAAKPDVAGAPIIAEERAAERPVLTAQDEAFVAGGDFAEQNVGLRDELPTGGRR
jgi:hypothetical protein